MNRRGFLSAMVVGVLATPLAVKGQQAVNDHRIGYLSSGSPSAGPHLIAAFKQGLREFGWVEGQNIAIEYRFAEGRFERLPALDSELIRLKPDVLVAVATPTAEVVRKATSTIPTVGITLGDPVR